MRVRFITCFLIILSTGPSPATEAQPIGARPDAHKQRTKNEIILELGQSTRLSAAPSATIRVGKGRIISATEDGRYIRVFGRNTGTATLLVDNQLYTIHVLSAQDTCLATAIDKQLPQMLGPRLEYANGNVILSGSLHRFEDWIKITQLAESCDGSFQNRSNIDSDIRAKIVSHIMENLGCAKATEKVCITSPLKKERRQELERQASALGVDITVDESQLRPEPLLRLQVLFVEVTKSEQTELGISWPTSAEFQLSPKWKNPQDLRATLKAMESKGQGQVLASPTLVARSGGEAEFLAGGEFPYKVGHRKNTEVQWKRHGVYLKFRPLADRSGNMKIEMTSEVSFPDGGQSLEAPPALKTNRVTSQFDLEKSKTLIISGLVKNFWGEQQAGLHSLINIPVIGRLFSSRAFMSNKSELLLFVTPEIIDKTDEQDKDHAG